ncbi:hypothetical protein K443DRAFT_117114 [Laccaria amethystina LaAM-08-1]|uniref:Uncharacterized protein n=1 Tax=Laccaria amethystina LaAM-08-1 TaxID=1095629 RepID=A0A0C9WGV2_9AGAR|nr:hypothetical protein K443DRAFT_117114 [Laccaria amethystina LaAM-08-1]
MATERRTTTKFVVRHCWLFYDTTVSATHSTFSPTHLAETQDNEGARGRRNDDTAQR